ncbi:MAG TPA: DUF4388 domain-containing protein [Pyrinomonadaceae bacterium]|nr:DUF4388 domain-containing protein [Pyrinomonadaceae bacterium]
MSTDESLSGCSLPEVVAILSQDKASGRLLINLGSTKAFFYFDNGELAAARMGPLTGLPAVNLAIAMNGTEFQFDPGFEIPPWDFKKAHEISLLQQILAIKETLIEERGIKDPKPLSELETTRRDQVTAVPVPYLFSAQSPQTEDTLIPSPTPATQSSTASSTIADSSPTPVPSSSPAPGPAEKTDVAERPRSKSSVDLVRQSGNAQASISVRASSILLLMAVAAVSITALRSKARPPVASGSLSEDSANSSAANTGVESMRKEIKEPPSVARAEATKAPSPKSSPEPTIVPERSVRIETGRVVDTTSDTVESRPAESPQPAPTVTELPVAETPASKLPFRRVPVVIRIENGFVAEAYIKNHQPGLEAFEATALRIARQRRYPKETKGVETIVVQVLTEP